MPLLSIAENIFLGNEQATNGVIDWNETFAAARRNCCDKVGLNEDPDTLITNIGVGKQQLVEIAKALSKKVKLLILDEPTASLNEKDSDALLTLLLEFKAQGISSILISHKLNEVVEGRRPHHRAARRPDDRDARHAQRDQRGPHHHGDGRPHAGRPLSRRARPRSARRCSR